MGIWNFQTKEQKIQNARAEIKRMYADFLKGDGRLPDGFSLFGSEALSYESIPCKTPFETYLHEIRAAVDRLRDNSGISEWLSFDGTADMNEAASAIAAWAKRHREMNRILQGKCTVRKTTFMLPVFTYCIEKIMFVLKDGGAFQQITEQSLHACISESISFCTVLSDRSMYDLTEQKKKEVEYITYPNYHDETYAEWWLGEAAQA